MASMERQCRWFSNLEDVREHQPQSVLWYLDGYEQGPLIFPAGHIPEGPVTRMGTSEELFEAMQQALASDASLRQSIQQYGALVIHAQMDENGTSYSFHPVQESSSPYR